MFRTTLFFAALLFSWIGVTAQPLARQAFLGVRWKALDSVLVVDQVVPGGTAAAQKWAVNDTLLALNGTALNTPAEVAQFMRGRKAGENITASFKQGKKRIERKGKLVGRPFETMSSGEIFYQEAAFKGGLLRVIVTRPSQANALPAMFFIPGYTCSSIDNLTPDHPYKRIIDAYHAAGFVTVRIEKSGLGDSEGTPSCESLDLQAEIENFEVGLQHLFRLPYVDTTKVVIYGHSMGGIVAPALAARKQVAGIVAYGTVAKSWFEYNLEMHRLQSMLGGMDPAEAEAYVQNQYDLSYRFFVGKEPLQKLAALPGNDSVLRNQWSWDGAGQIFSRNADYWRQIQDIPHLQNWQKAQASVLMQFGESDFQAFSKSDHEQIVQAVNFKRPGTAKLVTFAETDHYFAKSGSMQQAFDLFAAGKIRELFAAYNPEVGRSAAAWSLALVSDKKAGTGAARWEKLATEAYPGKQDDIWFINREQGWYVNGKGKLFKTVDGGKSWELLWEKPGSFFRTVAFIDDKTGFVGTVGTDYFPGVQDTIPLYKTTDGGKSWQPVAYSGNYVKGLCAIDIVKEAYIDRGETAYRYHVYAVGRVGSPANLLVSHDGGRTFTAQPMAPQAAMLFDIDMFDTQNGIACAASNASLDQSHAVMLHTTDGGKSWQEVYRSNRPYETTWKVSFPTREMGYATLQSYNPDTTVSQQRIIKTTDGGKSWQELPLVNNHRARPFGIGFIDASHGYVGTLSSGYRTRDGGQSWEPVDMGRATNKIRFYRDAAGLYGYGIGVNVLRFEPN